MIYTIQQGSQGIDVQKIQTYLNVIRDKHPLIPLLAVDGIYGSSTTTAVTTFQGIYALKPDGIVGDDTWDKLVTEFKLMNTSLTNETSASPLQPGSTGLAVQKFQSYLNKILDRCIVLNEDGVYGSNTNSAVMLYQSKNNLQVDGLIGITTWNSIVAQPEVEFII